MKIDIYNTNKKYKIIYADPPWSYKVGSGTTGIACMNTNRNFIGIEIDEKYFEIAKQRIEHERKFSNLD